MGAKQSAEMKEALRLHASGASVIHAAKASGVQRESLHAAIKKQKNIAKSKKIIQYVVDENNQEAKK